MKTYIFLLLLINVPFAVADNEVCPDGYYSEYAGEACVSLDFNRQVIMLPQTHNICNPGFEKPPGVNYCLAENIRMDMNGRQLILDPLPTDYCPEDFSRPTGSTLCWGDRLAFNTDVNGALVLTYPEICKINPKACGGRPISGETLAQAPPECPPGFIKPPGADRCIEDHSVPTSSTPQGLPIPTGNCPSYWRRQNNSPFCTPVYTLVACDNSQVCGGGELGLFKLVANSIDCPADTFVRFGSIPQVKADNSIIELPIWFCSSLRIDN